MKKFTKASLIGMILLLTSCSTSMSPIEINNKLPNLTKSKFISQSQAEEMTNSNDCKYLVKNRSYAAPIGLTKTNDLNNAARGIDEWVQLDEGNAYVLKNYKWVIVTDDTTQLHVEFDTLLCK
jgi:hypothetical protein